MDEPCTSRDDAPLGWPAEASLRAPGGASRRIELPTGRSVEVASVDGVDWLVVRSPAGQHLLTIRLDEAGPALSFPRASLEIAALDDVELSAGSLDVRAERDASIEVGGDLRERVAGAVTRESAGPSTTRARALAIEAFPGGVDVKAHGDVDLVGERVRLNSDDPPMPSTWDELRARRQRALAAGTGEATAAARDATGDGEPG